MSGIYIHIPFCKQACHYCDFHFSTSLKKRDDVIQSLIIELQLRKEELKGQYVKTIYFGGGTPSLLTVKELEIIFNTIYNNYLVIESPEITFEANPDDLTNRKIIELSQTPINRLSIGIQSFFEDDLKAMNRAHNANEAEECLKSATKYFDNITIDLIYGIPNMSLEKWRENLQITFNSGVNHISSYALTVEPKTALATFIKNGSYPSIDDEVALSHFEMLVEEAEKQRFIHYEVSNFGRPNYFSKHNTSYWQRKLYLGIGPSAHSFNGKQRSWNLANNIKYIEALQNNRLPNTIETLTVKDCYNEYIMTGLRTIWGISLEVLKQDFGEDYVKHTLKFSEVFITQNLLELTDSKTIIATKKGKFLVDGIASELFMLS